MPDNECRSLSRDISIPGKALMVLGKTGQDWCPSCITLETLDDPVPSSLSIKRPFNFGDGSEEYLQGAHGAVLGKFFRS